MKKTVAFEIRRTRQSRGFFISCLIGVFLCIVDIVIFCRLFSNELSNKSMLQMWIGTDFQLAFNSLFYVLLPILASLPFGASYYQDLKSGYVKNIILKTSRKRYYIGKSVATFFSAFVAVALPLVIDLMICMCIVPVCTPEKLSFLYAGILDRSLFALFFHTKPMIYCLCFIILDGIFAGILALFSICIAEFVDSAFSAIATPFVIYVLSGVAWMGDEKGNWSLLMMVNPIQTCSSRSEQVLACVLGGLVISLFIIWRKGRKKDIL